MKRTLHHTSVLFIFATLLMVVTSCSKSSEPAEEVDPATGVPPITVTAAGGDCFVAKIVQKYSDNAKADNVFEIKRDPALLPQSISSYDSILHKAEYDIRLQTIGDTVKSSTGEYFLINKTTKFVDYFYTRSDLNNPNSKKQVYQYLYDAEGYLTKKFLFVNGAVNEYYETNYSYDNNHSLTGCIVYAGSKKDKLLQSVLTYDTAGTKKPWIYLFPDFFEGYHYLQALPFGKKANRPLKSITTQIYDVNNGAIVDIWITNVSAYVFSKDGFILQATAKGDLQQGLGLIYGTTRFDYQCSK